MPGTEVFGIEEKKEVNDVLETSIMFRYNHDDLRKGHWKAKSFEQELATWTNAKHAHVCSSGSTAVALALAGAGIGFGDHVIVPPFTYIATIEAVINAGAIPIFAEIDETICLSPEGIAKAITPETKAVVLVHMCGAMAKIEEIVALCKEKNIILIEDSAQALGARYKGKALGTFGKVGCYSFDFFKIITAGEGGAIVTDDTQVYLNADMVSDHGHDHIGNNRGMEQHPVLGANYRISELHAAVGLAQIRKLDSIIERQKNNKKSIEATLAKFPGIEFRHLPDPEGDSATFFCIFLPDENKARKAVKALADQGLGCAYWYDNNFHFIKNWEHLRNLKTTFKMPLHTLDIPQDYNNLDLPKTYNLISRLISLQIRVTWTPEELNTHCQKLEAAFNQVFNA